VHVVRSVTFPISAPTVYKFINNYAYTYFLLRINYEPALGYIQPLIQWVSEALSSGIKRPRREADHSPPTSAKIKNTWIYTSIPLTRLRDVVLN
jgi:hypothetical protein